MTQTTPRRPGRPATGETPQRKVRIGKLWESCAELAAEQGITMTEFVERALRREHQRVERQLEQQRAEAERAAAAAAMPVATELTDDQAAMMVKVRNGWMTHVSDGTRCRFDGNARPHPTTQGEDLMLDKLLEAEMVSPEPRGLFGDGVLRVLGLTYTEFSLTAKGKAALIEWEEARGR